MNEIAITAERPLPVPELSGRAAVAALALVVAADLLFWDIGFGGLALFIFFALVALAILVARGAKPLTGRVVAGLALAILGALPLLEAPGEWALLSATFGAGMLALASADRWPELAIDLPSVLVRFGLLAPVRFIADAVGFALTAAEKGLGRTIVRNLVMWIVPLVLAVVFLGLFSAANPLIENALLAVKIDDALNFLHPARVIIWGFVLCFAWPLLVPRLFNWPQAPTVMGPHLPRAESIVFGPGAILRSLIVFNALFAVQTVLDIAYLWGGLTLPEGMTYAHYAHRGAYPLIATALLAAAFVLAAMRPDGAAERSPVIRYLVYAFIAQNVMLVVSSILRLDLYVETYMLTELRVAAGIWMGLVAIGLLLILARIALRKSNKWLIATNLLTLGLTLYGCAYVDFGAIIARFNADHSLEMTGQGVALDVGYLRYDVGPVAIPALDHFMETMKAKGWRDAELAYIEQPRAALAYDHVNRSRDWRFWTFRDWRLDQYLAGSAFAVAADPDRTATMPPEERPDSATMP